MRVREYIERRRAEARAEVEGDEKWRAIAERIAKEHNVARRVVNPTHVVFSAEGWYPRLTDQAYGWPLEAIVVPLRDGDVTADEVLEDLVDHVAQREEERDRRMEPAKTTTLRGSGWRKGQPQCGSCHKFIATPKSTCESCGYDNGAERFTERSYGDGIPF